ncbi:GNAT family N-acetyltransferase [Allokutzneria albata]|uniref:GNAT family N-acetyltransferase n=1 Tax=Allokutzneria albata TaxID=211114 RepID=UPI0006944BBB|nr:GNAT family N-acetyltransferase [Allokutzneria albata]
MVDWVRLKLDADGFDETEFVPYLDRARASGVDFTTMTELDDRLALYELNKTCSADIPERGEFFTYDEYVANRIEVPSFRADGVVLALRDGRWIGMTMTGLYPGKDTAFTEMTGVLAEERGRGLSLALKVLSIRFVRASGFRWLRTFHHPRNFSAIGMNRRLGFVDD